MFSLLPEREKKQIMDEYRLRILIVSLSFLVVVGVVAILLLIPSYIVSVSEHKEIVQRIQTVRQSGILKEEVDLNKELSRTNLKIKSLNESAEAVPMSVILGKALSYKNSDIRVSGISFKTLEKNGQEIILTGVARNRDSLSKFVKELQAEPLFTGVDIPVSDFAKDRNASFSVKLTLK